MARQAVNMDDDEEEDDDEEDEGHAKDRASQEPVRQTLVRTVKNKKIENLEDLYAAFPEFPAADGSYYLKLTRLLPQRWLGNNMAGLLADKVYNKISNNDIKMTYGGGKYCTSMMGPASGPVDANGNAPIRTLKSFEFIIHGDPCPHIPVGNSGMLQPIEGREPVLPIVPDVVTPPPQDKAMTQQQIPQGVQAMQMVPGMMQPIMQAAQEHPTVAIEKLKVEDRQRERENSRRDDSAKAEREIIADAVKQVRDAYDKQINDLIAARDKLYNQLSDKDKQLFDQNQQIAKANNEASIATRMHDDVKGRLERVQADCDRLRDERQKTIEENDRRWRERLDNEKDRLESELSRARHDQTTERERERLARDSSERSLRDEMDRRLSSQKETFEGRVADLERNTKREIDTVKENRDRQLDAIKEAATVRNESLKSSYEVQFAALTAEAVRLRAEVDRLVRKNDDLVKAAHKDPLQYIQEVRDVASGVLGMEPAGSGAAGEEETGDWKKMVTRGALGLVEKVPEIIQQAAQLRAQNAQQRQQNQNRQNGQPQRPQAPQQGGRMLPPPPPWQQNGGYNGVVAPLRPVQEQARSPMQQNGLQAQQPTPQAVQAQPQGQQVVSQEQLPLPMVQQQPMQARQPMQQVPVQPVAQQAQQQLPVEQAQQLQKQFEVFLDQLDSAIREGVVPPNMFARMLVEQVGKDMSIGLLQQFPTPDRLFDEIEKAGAASSIVTRDGKKFTNAVWIAVKALVA